MPAPDALKCSFCSASRDQYRRLVPGPEVYICNVCVDRAVEAILRNAPNAALPDTTPDTYCAFCGKTSTQVKRLATTATARICDECLGEAFKILMEEDEHIPGAISFDRVT